MQDKTVLITGSTSGVGRYLARDLAVRGATVLLQGRDRQRLEAVATEINALGAPARTYEADLADLDQVDALAERVRATESRLDVLVNNAAVGGGDPARGRELSRQGHELRFAVNYLAPYRLISGLHPLLAASAPARVVNVASIGQAPVDVDDLALDNGYEAVDAYCRSKLALIMATFDLAEELREQRITVNALHPAHLMDTPMVHASGFTPITTVDAGVLPALRLVADPALTDVTGRYFDRFDEARAHEQAYDEAVRARLAAATQALLARTATSRSAH